MTSRCAHQNASFTRRNDSAPPGTRSDGLGALPHHPATPYSCHRPLFHPMRLPRHRRHVRWQQPRPCHAPLETVSHSSETTEPAARTLRAPPDLVPTKPLTPEPPETSRLAATHVPHPCRVTNDDVNTCRCPPFTVYAPVLPRTPQLTPARP